MGLYWLIHSVPKISQQKILKLENDGTFYQQQVEYGLKRSQMFSWRNTAESLLSIYKELSLSNICPVSKVKLTGK